MTSSVLLLTSDHQKNETKASRTKAMLVAAAVSLSSLALFLPESASARGTQYSNEIKGETMVAGYYPSRGGYPSVYERRGNVIIPSSRCARCL